MSNYHIIIPSRFASTRLPGKPLLDVCGKPLIQRVYERALQSKATDVVIATDDERIAEAAENFHAQICMTSEHHPTGTDRIAEVVDKMGYADDEIVVNVQGDEPLIPPYLIDKVAGDLIENEFAEVSTLCEQIIDFEQLFDPNIVKVVMDNDGYAMYFSRAPIPWNRDQFKNINLSSNDSMTLLNRSLISDCYYRHIGIFAYRVGLLREFTAWPHCIVEVTEKLEQLRILWNGCGIYVGISDETTGIGVDTEEDLAKVRKLFAE